MENKITPNYSVDWKWGAAGSVFAYLTGICAICGILTTCLSGMAVASIWSFTKAVKRVPKESAKPLHQFVPTNPDHKIKPSNLDSKIKQ